MRERPWFLAILALFLFFAPGHAQQKKECPFLNETCNTKEPTFRAPWPPPDTRTPAQHLERCLADYLRRHGQFMPEGRSTRLHKSKSDMTAMCQFAIAQKNYYWDIPDTTDQTASFNCCVKMQNGNVKVCREAFERGRALNSRIDYCSFLHQDAKR